MDSKRENLERGIAHSKELGAGGDHYRAYIGPPEQFDFMGATQFRLLTALGLTEEHTVVDLGCGSLRAGRLLLHYLVPGRYIGIDPNSWLWETALTEEIGHDIIAIKQPQLLTDDSLEMVDLGPQVADFIVAQSIYSHTGVDVFQTSVAAAKHKLAETGQFLFTAIPPGSHSWELMQSGTEASGWIYPQCVVLDEPLVADVCRSAGLHVQKLPWFHPRQTWFRAVVDDRLLLSDQDMADMGTGRPLFDPRF